MSIIGQKHSIKCRCILPQFKKREDPIFHEFIVFSTSNGDEFNESFAQCNNCGIVHKIVDFCKSEIIQAKENLRSVQTKSDMALQLPDDIVSLLESNNCDIAQYQHIAFIIDNKKIGEKLLLEKEEIDGYVTGKFLSLADSGRFRVEPFTYQSGVEEK